MNLKIGKVSIRFRTTVDDNFAPSQYSKLIIMPLAIEIPPFRLFGKAFFLRIKLGLVYSKLQDNNFGGCWINLFLCFWAVMIHWPIKNIYGK